MNITDYKKILEDSLFFERYTIGVNPHSLCILDETNIIGSWGDTMKSIVKGLKNWGVATFKFFVFNSEIGYYDTCIDYCISAKNYEQYYILFELTDFNIEMKLIDPDYEEDNDQIIFDMDINLDFADELDKVLCKNKKLIKENSYRINLLTYENLLERECNIRVEMSKEILKEAEIYKLELNNLKNG